VGLARELGYRSIQIQTNGRMLSYAPFVDALLRAGATEFAPALHGADAATHDGLVRARGAFDQVLKGLAHLSRRGVRVVMNSVILQQNTEQLPAMARLFVGLGVQQFQFAFVHALGTAAQHFSWVVPRYSVLELRRPARA
jgi:MoaA/NifB/PqqE/SkfB family radical SAM enzyme